MWFDVLSNLGNQLDTFNISLKIVYIALMAFSAYVILSPDSLKRFSRLSTWNIISKVFAIWGITLLGLGVVYFVTVPRVLLDQLFLAFGEFGKTVLSDVQFDRIGVYVEEKVLRFDFESLIPPLTAFQIGGQGTNPLVYFILSKYNRTTSDDVLNAIRNKIPSDRPLEVFIMGLNQQEVFAGFVAIKNLINEAQISIKVQPLVFSSIPFSTQDTHEFIYTRSEIEDSVRMLLDARARKPLVDSTYISLMLFIVLGSGVWALLQLFTLWIIYYVIFTLLKVFLGQELIEYPKVVAFFVAILLIGAIALLPFDLLTLIIVIPLVVLGILHLKSQRFMS